jgi:hypothetical protein
MIKKIIVVVGLVTILCSSLNAEEVELKKRSCSDDIDCVLFEPYCCWGCSYSSSVNKFYLNELKLQKEEKCRDFEDMCPEFECLPIAHEAYCDEERYCSKKVDCKRTCALMGVSGLDSDYAKNESGCSCEDF